MFLQLIVRKELVSSPRIRALAMRGAGYANRFDVDPEAARRTRRAFLERHADRPVLVLGTHFATPPGGRIVRDGEVWRFAV